ncbi:enoyl-CoA hydratase/isomerase family protein [Nonomuraea sp. KC401]|uniref:enoyl-CoA hydratase/isomerase family protein n=1 Tax=unclassified Nonomuraea TaxID=2593643 RepID=UPI0010FD1FE8|nr:MULTISPECIES: enoyl-CoA hydratase/isomerase family protein [unclassified Nonomuraea]NBE99894.1 enoyl-CoA hydratase/isomerase family protein [Nonomuraea sp. K271]TLF55218.1 enoyl-CoA hydratase/isomerase family protein [Nonomuraea sp. KC401]
MSEHVHVHLDVDGPVAVITLNRPDKLNAITPGMAAALRAGLDRVDADPGVRVAVLTGAGERSFCVGSDIGELDAYATPWEFRNRGDYGDAVRALRKPVIAAVNGYAYGGGLELAMACDIRLAADTATFAAPEIKLGWIGGSGQSALLAHAVGPSNAATMLLTGDPIDASRALRWGLVTDLHPREELLPAALELAGRIAARPPIAAQTAKANVRAAYSMPLEQAIRYERDLQTVCFATADAAEGRAAFAERREPVFEGR